VIVQATRLYKRYGADPVCKPLLGSCIRAYRTDCSVRARWHRRALARRADRRFV